MDALKNRYFDDFKKVLELGASPNQVNGYNETPLIYLIKQNRISLPEYLEVFKILIENKNF